MMMKERGSTPALRKEFLESQLKDLAQQEKWDLFNQPLILTIYRLVLFLFTPDIVDQTAMDMFFRFSTYDANLVPTILADTFLSMEVSHQKKGEKLRCCSHMLYVWVMTHMLVGNHMGSFPNPLKSFYHIPIKP